MKLNSGDRYIGPGDMRKYVGFELCYFVPYYQGYKHGICLCFLNKNYNILWDWQSIIPMI